MSGDAQSAREIFLIEAARYALRWFTQRGRGLNSPNDEVFVARALQTALEQYPDVPPMTDVDRRAAHAD